MSYTRHPISTPVPELQGIATIAKQQAPEAGPAVDAGVERETWAGVARELASWANCGFQDEGYEEALAVMHRGAASLRAAISASGSESQKSLASLIEAEANKPLQGPTHGAWDRGVQHGLRKASKIIRAAALAQPPAAERVTEEDRWRPIEQADTEQERLRVLGFGYYRGQKQPCIAIMDWVKWIGTWSAYCLPFKPTHFMPLPDTEALRPAPDAGEGGW